MSKRKQTDNLHLYAYILSRNIPTFLKDWSDNMEILDSAHSAVLDAINALDVRLTSAENTLEDLSPESIEDYKVRLNALENKVKVNTNAIKDVNTRVNTVDAQIRSINAEQITQNNRLDAIEAVNNTQNTAIANLVSSLNTANGVINNHETRIRELEHEVSDLQNDVNGFNDDVAIITQQVDTLSSAVSTLTDLVNGLQLDVVSERLDSLSTIIGDTDISGVADTITNAIVELARQISELTPEAYEALEARVSVLETDLTDLTGVVATKADSSTVSALATDVAGKADSSTVSALDTRVGAIETTINGLGSLATQNSASGNYTPSGGVSVELTGGVAGVAPSLTYDSSTESISFNAGTVTVVGVPSASFSGTQETITVQ